MAVSQPGGRGRFRTAAGPVGRAAIVDAFLPRVCRSGRGLDGGGRLLLSSGAVGLDLDFYSDDPTPRAQMTTDEVRSLLAGGHFAPGSMGPKMEATIDYLEAIDGETIVCRPEDLGDALLEMLENLV